MMDTGTVAALARELYPARKTRTPLRHFSQRHPSMTVAWLVNKIAPCDEHLAPARWCWRARSRAR